LQHMNSEYFAMTRKAAAALMGTLLASSLLIAQNPTPLITKSPADLVAVLKSDASQKEKADACRELAVIGNKEAIDVLIPLLADEKLSHMARYALETMQDPAVNPALRNALPQLKGRQLCGTIVTLGVRRDAEAVKPLGEYLSNPDPDVAQAAARALGDIGTVEAQRLLMAALRNVNDANRLSVCEGLLRCADNALKSGRSRRAIRVYDALRRQPSVPHQVKAGAVIAEQDHSIQDAQLRQAQGNLAATQARLATLQDGPREETVAGAQANLAAAQAKLAQIKAGPTEAQIKAAEAQLRLAQNQLYSVQAQADAMIASKAVNMLGSAVYTQDMKAAAAGVAFEQIQAAQAQLDGLKAPPQPELVAQAQAAVDAAEQQLKLAQNPYTQHDIEAAQAQVTIAQAAVDLAQAQINQMIIKSPVDGVIADKMVSQGALVGPTTPLVNIISEDVDIVVPVDQDQVQQIAVGQTVTCIANNDTGNPITGTITSVAPAGDPRSRSFSAKIKPDDPQHKLKAGMFVQVQIATVEKQNALLIPKTAAVDKNGEQVVFVVSNGAAAMKKVTLGISDGTNVEITSGLDGNNPIITTGLNKLADGDKIVVVQ
jgi:RND family efflux transporter MFP subunit